MRKPGLPHLGEEPECDELEVNCVLALVAASVRLPFELPTTTAAGKISMARAGFDGIAIATSPTIPITPKCLRVRETFDAMRCPLDMFDSCSLIQWIGNLVLTFVILRFTLS